MGYVQVDGIFGFLFWKRWQVPLPLDAAEYECVKVAVGEAKESASND